MNWWREKSEQMVRTQILSRGITQPEILDAMKKVPRHLFVPESAVPMAYEDCALPVSDGQTISQPYMVARMTELLDVQKGDRVLEIGTGSGYQAAVLAEIGVELVSVERIESLALNAERLLKSQGYKVKVIVGDGRKGYIEKAPYKRIIITAACVSVEKEWEEQIERGGSILLPLKIGPGMERLLLREKKGSDTFSDSWYDYCHFVPVVRGVMKKL